MPAVNQADRIVAALREADLSKERALFEHQSPDPELFADDLEKAARRARQSFVAVQAVKRRTDEAVRVKKKALKAYQKAFLRVARIFEDLCRLAGMDKIARRLRTSPDSTSADQPSSGAWRE